MWIRSNGRMINLDAVKQILCQEATILSGEPSITFIHGYGEYLPITTEIKYPDFPTAERWFDELHKAIQANVPVFDMR